MKFATEFSQAEMVCIVENKTVPILTPKFILNQELQYTYKGFLIGASFRYQSKSYVDFANLYKIPSYGVINVLLGYKKNHSEINIHLNNITNAEYYTMGLMNVYETKPLYFVQSPFNLFVTYKITL